MDDEVRVARKVMSERVELFRVPVIEDDLAIQMVVCRRLASEPLDTKHASLLLYGLQVGSGECAETRQKGPERFSNHKIF